MRWQDGLLVFLAALTVYNTYLAYHRTKIQRELYLTRIEKDAIKDRKSRKG